MKEKAVICKQGRRRSSRGERDMIRRVTGWLLAASFATTGVLAAGPAAADRGCGRGRAYRGGHAGRVCAPVVRNWGPRPCRRVRCDDDDFPLGAVLGGAALGYGAYRLYDYLANRDGDEDCDK
jgi:hypothetical protein